MTSIDLKCSSETKNATKERQGIVENKRELLTNFLIFLVLAVTLGVLIFASVAT